MTQKTIGWIVGLVALILIGLWVWQRGPSVPANDLATTTPATTTDSTSSTPVSNTTSPQPTNTKAPGNLPNGAYTLDTDASLITWIGRKPRILGYEDVGTLKLKEGELEVQNGHIVSGNFTMDMQSITATKTSNTKVTADKLETHLKSADFFAVETYPTGRFIVKNVTNGTVTGDLTIKGITKTISFPATITPLDNNRIAASADITLNRTNWDIRYGSDSFFKNLGDNLIADEITIHLDLLATK